MDEEDLPLLSQCKWQAKRNYGKWYAATTIDKRTILMHRLLLGFPPEHTDHKNGNGLDNRRSNLRAATASQNSFNRPSQGVYRHGPGWRAHICKDRKQHISPTFKTKDEALEWRRQKALELFGEFVV